MLENEYAKFWIENGVLFFEYKTGVVLDLEAAKLIVSDRLRVQDGKAYPVFCDARGIKDWNKAARDYLAKEGSYLITKVGLLVDTPLSLMTLNFYLTINKPLVPTQIFTDKIAALQYLMSELDQNKG